MKNFNDRAELGILVMVPVVVIISVFLIATFGNILPTNITTTQNAISGVYASNTLTFSGNVSCNEIVNVTNAAGATAVFRFNISQISAVNEGYCGATIPEYATVNINQMWNTSDAAARNITTVMNANSTISGTMAASVSGSTVTLKYNSVGLTGNNVVTSEKTANGVWASAALSGGQHLASVWPTGATETMKATPTMIISDYIIAFVVVLLAAIGIFVKVTG